MISKNGIVELAKVAKDNPGTVLSGLLNAVMELPHAVAEGLKETGTAIGEGALRVGLDQNSMEKLNAIYGTDVAGVQKTLLLIRVVTAVSGATGVAKSGVK